MGKNKKTGNRFYRIALSQGNPETGEIFKSQRNNFWSSKLLKYSSWEDAIHWIIFHRSSSSKHLWLNTLCSLDKSFVLIHRTQIPYSIVSPDGFGENLKFIEATATAWLESLSNYSRLMWRWYKCWWCIHDNDIQKLWESMTSKEASQAISICLCPKYKCWCYYPEFLAIYLDFGRELWSARNICLSGYAIR